MLSGAAWSDLAVHGRSRLCQHSASYTGVQSPATALLRAGTASAWLSELDDISKLLPEPAKASSLSHLFSYWKFGTVCWEEDLLLQLPWRGKCPV